MTVERFYLDSDLVKERDVSLSGGEFHHARVLRLSVGDTVELINGKGDLAQGQTVSLTKESMQLRVESVSHTSPSTIRIAIAVPLMRPAKLEWVVEKGTELGADSFLLYGADHSEKESLSSHQAERLHAIAISAMKQSKRLYLPALEILPHLSSLWDREASFFFGDASRASPYFRNYSASQTIFITGPEKGFSPKESAGLLSKAKGASLSPNILRAETAPLAALTLFFASL